MFRNTGDGFPAHVPFPRCAAIWDNTGWILLPLAGTQQQTFIICGPEVRNRNLLAQISSFLIVQENENIVHCLVVSGRSLACSSRKVKVDDLVRCSLFGEVESEWEDHNFTFVKDITHTLGLKSPTLLLHKCLFPHFTPSLHIPVSHIWSPWDALEFTDPHCARQPAKYSIASAVGEVIY